LAETSLSEPASCPAGQPVPELDNASPVPITEMARVETFKHLFLQLFKKFTYLPV